MASYETEREENHSSKRKGRSYWGLAIGLLVFAALFLLGLVPKLNNDHKIEAQAKDTANEVPQVQVVRGKLTAQDNRILPGTVQALNETAIQSRTQGYVSKLLVDIGSKVTKGQLLAVIEAPDVDQQVYQAQADTNKSRAVVGQSMADLARSKAGFSESVANLDRQKATIKQSQSSYSSALGKLEQAKAAEQMAESRLDQSKHALETQKANLTQAQAQQTLATVTAGRYATLLKQGFVAQQDYDVAATTVKTTHETVNAAVATVKSAESDVSASENNVKAAKDLVKSAKDDAEAAEDTVKANEESYQSLLSARDAAKETINDSQQTVQANQAGVESSIANEKHFAAMQSFENIVAPYDGVITSKNVEVGSLVSPGAIAQSSTTNTTPSVGLLGIARSDELAIYVNIPQSYYQAVANGAPINIRVRELPGKVFNGTLKTLSGAIDQTTRTLQAEVVLPNQNGVLLPGMYAQVEIPSANVTKTMRIPSNTLEVDSQGTRVMVVDAQNKAYWRKVEIGRDFGTELEVLNGIGPDDLLVENPSTEIKDGETVKPTLEQQSESSAAGGQPGQPAGAPGTGNPGSQGSTSQPGAAPSGGQPGQPTAAPTTGNPSAQGGMAQPTGSAPPGSKN